MLSIHQTNIKVINKTRLWDNQYIFKNNGNDYVAILKPVRENDAGCSCSGLGESVQLKLIKKFPSVSHHYIIVRGHLKVSDVTRGTSRLHLTRNVPNI